MTPAVDNFARGNTESEQLMLPEVEQLVRLYEHIERYASGHVDSGIMHACRRHRLAHGHELRFGCCRDVPLDRIVC